MSNATFPIPLRSLLGGVIGCQLPTMGTVGSVNKGNPVEKLFSGQDVVDCYVPLGSYSVRDPGGMQTAPKSSASRRSGIHVHRHSGVMSNHVLRLMYMQLILRSCTTGPVWCS